MPLILSHIEGILEFDTPIFLYNLSEASVKFADSAI